MELEDGNGELRPGEDCADDHEPPVVHEIPHGGQGEEDRPCNDGRQDVRAQIIGDADNIGGSQDEHHHAHQDGRREDHCYLCQPFQPGHSEPRMAQPGLGDVTPSQNDDERAGQDEEVAVVMVEDPYIIDVRRETEDDEYGAKLHLEKPVVLRGFERFALNGMKVVLFVRFHTPCNILMASADD